MWWLLSEYLDNCCRYKRSTIYHVNTVDLRNVSRGMYIVSESSLRALCWNVTQHKGGHSHASLSSPFLGQSSVPILSGPGSDRMGAPRVCLCGNRKMCLFQSNDLTRLYVVTRDWLRNLLLSYSFKSHRCYTSCKLAVICSRIIIFSLRYAEAVKDLRKARFMKINSVTHEIYEIKNLQINPYSINKISPYSLEAKSLPDLLIIYIYTSKVLLKGIFRFLLCWK